MMIGPEVCVWMVEKINDYGRFGQGLRRPCRPFGIGHRDRPLCLPAEFSLQVFARENRGDDAVKTREMKVDGKSIRHGRT